MLSHGDNIIVESFVPSKRVRFIGLSVKLHVNEIIKSFSYNKSGKLVWMIPTTISCIFKKREIIDMW